MGLPRLFRGISSLSLLACADGLARVIDTQVPNSGIQRFSQLSSGTWDPDSLSGPGSRPEVAAPFVQFFLNWLKEHKDVQSMVEASAGHWPSGWQRTVNWPALDYVGVDLLPEVIEADKKFVNMAAEQAARRACWSRDHRWKYKKGTSFATDFTRCGSNSSAPSDKFGPVQSADVCDMCCKQLENEGCRYWTFGAEDGMNKCWFRRKEGNKVKEAGYTSGSVDDCQIRTTPQTLGFKSMKFVQGDMLKDQDLPKADLFLTKDTLIHFPNRYIMQFLNQSVLVCPPKYKYVMFVHDFRPRNDYNNADIKRFGDYHGFNLELPPFSLPVETVFKWRYKEPRSHPRLVQLLNTSNVCK